MTMNFIHKAAIAQICPLSGEPQTPYERGVVRRYVAFGTLVVQQFVEEVNRRAERNLETTGRLEGAHYAAMRSVLAELLAPTESLDYLTTSFIPTNDQTQT